MALLQSAFESLVIGVQPSSIAHKNALPGFLAAATRAASVHSDAAVLSSTSGYIREKRHEAVMLLTCHAFNLYVDLISTIFAGRFDAACYLARPFRDISALIGFVGADESRATAFLTSAAEVKASEARREAVARLQGIDEAMAKDVERIFKEDYDAANTLSHVNVTQLAKLVERTGPASQRATLGGRVDIEEATAMLRLAGYCEVMTLSALRQVGEFGKRWDDRCGRAIEAVMQWSRTA